MTAILTTDAIAPAERIDWWRGRVSDLFGADYRIEPSYAVPFSIGVEMSCAEPLTVVRVRGSAHCSKGLSDPGSEARLLIHLQLSGHLQLRAEGREIQLAPGHLALFPARESTDLDFPEAYEHITAVLPVSLVENMAPAWPRHAVQAIPARSGTTAVLADHLHSLSRHPEALASAASASLVRMTVGLIGAFLSELEDSAPKHSGGLRAYHIGRIKQYALAHLANPTLEINDISNGVGLSPRYIHRLFQGEPLPIMQWVQKERLIRCYRALADKSNAGKSICEIAFSLGFSDQANFTRSFRKLFDMSPKEARTTGTEARFREIVHLKTKN